MVSLFTIIVSESNLFIITCQTPRAVSNNKSAFVFQYLNLFQEIFTTKLKREKLQDIPLIVIQFHQYIIILNKARRPIHINVFILTELTLLISSSSFIINLYLEQNFSEDAHLYLLFVYLCAAGQTSFQNIS